MKRLYFTTDSLDSAEAISNNVHGAGISDWNFHVMSKDDSGMYKRHIHSTNLFHENNFLQQAERGGLIGACVGALLVILLNFYSEATMHLAASMAAILFSMFTGSWFGGFIGMQQENYKISRFHDDLEIGKYLVMIDVNRDDMARIEAMMAQEHHEVEFNGVGSSLVLPF